MLKIEQFIYTTADINNKKGYQIVAKSDGIKNNTLDSLEIYTYPIDVEPAKFKESRSLVLLDNDLVAYSITKNVGTGYDGRENSIYNHTFIFTRKNFKDHDYDSRILNELYLEDKDVRGILPTLSVDPPKLLPPLMTKNMENILENVLASLFENKKTALVIDDVNILQDILLLLPRSLRLIPFSTLVIDPKKQPGYDFISNPDLNRSNIPKNFRIITLDEQPPAADTEFKESMWYYSELIRNQDYDKIEEIQNRFETQQGTNNENKINLICNYIRYNDAVDKKDKTLYAEKILKNLKQFDQKTFSHYFKEIKDSLDRYNRLKREIPDEVNSSMSFMEAIFYMPFKILDDIFSEPSRKPKR